MITRKITGALMASVLLLLALPVFAADLPSEFWTLNDNYGVAVSSENYPDIVKYGSEIVDMVLKEPQTEQTVNIIGSRAYETANAAFLLGDYDTALKYFEIYLPYGEKENWTDGVYIAKNYIEQLTPVFDIYKQTDKEQKYYGAKNEPHGILVGQTSENSKAGDSMILLYLEYGEESYFDWARQIFKRARANGISIELALNFPNEGNTARNIRSSDSYLNSLYSMISEYNDVPVFLRIGAEMNIWENTCTPDEFIRAFRTVSEYMRPLPNVAIVWSVAHTSRWYSESWPYTAHSFYPGDSWVDWVGVTAYANKYFNAKIQPNKEKFTEVCFKTGYNADPVIMVKDIVDTYGSRKPIMISEGGGSYRTNGSMNKVHYEWGADRVKEIFNYIPMVYPQVKLMAYFNHRVDWELNYYDLESAWQLAEAFETATASPWFIRDGKKSASTYFEKAKKTITANEDGTLTLSAYTHLYGSDVTGVDYYLDGKQITYTTKIPYTINLTNLSGTHTLRATAYGSNGSSEERTYTIKGAAEKEDKFSDMSDLNDIQKAAIDFAVENGIMSGYEDGTVRPMNNITRAEFATMTCRMMGYTASSPCTFEDAATHWATNYINACVSAGAINGVGDNLFAPQNDITLEQATKIITIVRNMASPDYEYPTGFLNAGKAYGILENLTSNETTLPINRIDVAVMMMQAMR